MNRVSYSGFGYPVLEASALVAGGTGLYALIKKRFGRGKSAAAATAATSVAATALLSIKPPIDSAQLLLAIQNANTPEALDHLEQQIEDEALLEEIALRRVKLNEPSPLPTPAELLAQMLYDAGRKIVDVERDGACLFHACAAGIDGWDAAKLREAVVESHRNNASLAEFITDSLEKYCEKVSQKTFWGGEPELNAIPDILHSNIKVYTPIKEMPGELSDTKICKTYPLSGSTYEKTIEVMFKDGHYWIVEAQNGEQ